MPFKAKAKVQNVFQVINKKSNGKEFITTRCQILEGPGAGMTVLATRTLGADKAEVTEGMEVTIHGHEYEGSIRWEIQTGLTVSDDAAVLAAFGVKASAPAKAEVTQD